MWWKFIVPPCNRKLVSMKDASEVCLLKVNVTTFQEVIQSFWEIRSLATPPKGDLYFELLEVQICFIVAHMMNIIGTSINIIAGFMNNRNIKS